MFDRLLSELALLNRLEELVLLVYRRKFSAMQVKSYCISKIG
jgi:hypothetical protein